MIRRMEASISSIVGSWAVWSDMCGLEARVESVTPA
jgi:hypothetical protein